MDWTLHTYRNMASITVQQSSSSSGSVRIFYRLKHWIIPADKVSICAGVSMETHCSKVRWARYARADTEAQCQLGWERVSTRDGMTMISALDLLSLSLTEPQLAVGESEGILVMDQQLSRWAFCCAMKCGFICSVVPGKFCLWISEL